MAWLAAVMLLGLQDSSPPDRFEFSTPRGYVVGRVPFDLTITADRKDFSGTVPVAGLAGVDSVTFAGGTATLEGVLLEGDTVTVGGTAWSPRVIPGWLSVVPPLVAIGLAIATRQVLVSLLAGIFVGVAILVGPLLALLRTFDTFLVDSLASTDNAKILLFTLALGGMVGVITRSGGTRALVDALATRARTRRAGMVTTWAMGLAVFFDDYANCLLVGNAARPFTDRLRISREKLAFIIDATAAPVAGTMFVSTWVGYEVGLFRDMGLIEGDVFTWFLWTIPYRFYSLLMLLFVLVIAVTRRDFGPMLRAERRAFSTGKVLRDGAAPLMDRDLTDMPVPDGVSRRASNAVAPIVVVTALVVVGLLLKQDSFNVLTWAAFGGSAWAVLQVWATGALKPTAAIEAWLAGAKAMMLACIILVLAWTLGGLCREHLMTGPWVISLVRPPVSLLPLIVFLASCLIAFATGTSFGTMAIVIPIAGPMAWALTGTPDFDPASADALRMATLGAVLSGALFGDHCSPISDTTVMSSMAAASDHVDHVRTQMPYALACAGVAAVVGYVPAGFGVPPAVSLVLGAVAVVLVVRLLGRDAEAPAG